MKIARLSVCFSNCKFVYWDVDFVEGEEHEA